MALAGSALAAEPAAKKSEQDAKASSGKRPAPKASGEVNWSGPVLKATGSGAPDMKATSPAQARLGAEMAAKMDAFRNLISQAKGVQISSGQTVGDAMSADEIRGRVEGVIRGYKVTAKRYYSDQGVELDVEVPMGAIVEAVVPAEDKAIGLKTNGPQKHTGVIVDARGLGVTPALAPRLIDESGATVYASGAVSAEARRSQGVASYFITVDEAKKSERVGDKPLVIKALRANGADLVLSKEALKELESSNQSYLAEGRVAIVSQ